MFYSFNYIFGLFPRLPVRVKDLLDRRFHPNAMSGKDLVNQMADLVKADLCIDAVSYTHLTLPTIYSV